jgi:hypothetical protein
VERNVIGRDSLKNDGLTAVCFAVCLCEAVGAEGDPPYWRGTLAVRAIGAGVGAAANVGIDTMRSRTASSSPWSGRRLAVQDKLPPYESNDATTLTRGIRHCVE